VLNQNAQPIKVIAYSKRWWNDQVRKARSKYSRKRRNYRTTPNIPLIKERLKQARNNYYHIVRKEKRECWQKFLKGSTEILENNSRLEDTNRCWTALRYISARLGFSTPAIKAVNGTIATTIEEKKAVFLKSAFSGPIKGLTENPPISI
jgi:hypothetical protein